ncbi:hypothetical protein PENTCL1PPCAC_25221, partial [Pristionchus entomophagus]
WLLQTFAEAICLYSSCGVFVFFNFVNLIVQLAGDSSQFFRYCALVLFLLTLFTPCSFAFAAPMVNSCTFSFSFLFNMAALSLLIFEITVAIQLLVDLSNQSLEWPGAKKVFRLFTVVTCCSHWTGDGKAFYHV